MSIKKENDVSRIAFKADKFCKVTDNLLEIGNANLEVKDILPAFYRKTMEIIENAKNISVQDLIELQRKYFELEENFKIIATKNFDVVENLEENMEVIPNFEVEEIDLVWSDKNKGVKIDSNTCTVDVTVEEIEKISGGISFEKCTKNQLIMMILSSIAIISAMDNEDNYSTDVVLSTLKEICQNYDIEKNLHNAVNTKNEQKRKVKVKNNG